MRLIGIYPLQNTLILPILPCVISSDWYAAVLLAVLFGNCANAPHFAVLSLTAVLYILNFDYWLHFVSISILTSHVYFNKIAVNEERLLKMDNCRC